MSFFNKIFGGKKEQKPEEWVLDGSHGKLIVAFQHRIGQKIKWEELTSHEYAMWLPSEGDSRFSNSEFTTMWTEVFALTSKYWSYITADLLKALEIAGKDEKRSELPEKPAHFAFLTAEGEQIILSLSIEKGIRLHFASTTLLEYRLNFLTDFLNYCRGWNGLLGKQNVPHDEAPGFAQWWTLTMEASKTAELKEPVLAVGKIIPN